MVEAAVIEAQTAHAGQPVRRARRASVVDSLAARGGGARLDRYMLGDHAPHFVEKSEAQDKALDKRREGVAEYIALALKTREKKNEQLQAEQLALAMDRLG